MSWISLGQALKMRPAVRLQPHLSLQLSLVLFVHTQQTGHARTVLPAAVFDVHRCLGLYRQQRLLEVDHGRLVLGHLKTGPRRYKNMF